MLGSPRPWAQPLEYPSYFLPSCLYVQAFQALPHARYLSGGSRTTPKHLLARAVRVGRLGPGTEFCYLPYS